MPMYTYECPDCAARVVDYRRIADRDAEIVGCCRCGGGPMPRAFDTPILHPSAVPSRSCRGGGS